MYSTRYRTCISRPQRSSTCRETHRLLASLRLTLLRSRLNRMHSNSILKTKSSLILTAPSLLTSWPILKVTSLLLILQSPRSSIKNVSLKASPLLTLSWLTRQSRKWITFSTTRAHQFWETLWTSLTDKVASPTLKCSLNISSRVMIF